MMWMVVGQRARAAVAVVVVRGGQGGEEEPVLHLLLVGMRVYLPGSRQQVLLWLMVGHLSTPRWHQGLGLI